jgi:tripartite-type tricarboxylate transporter receptor subunit TctC
VPYRGGGPAAIALLANEVSAMFGGGSVVPTIKSGKLRGLAVTTPKRLAALPDMPAVAEALPGFEVVGWYGVIGPADLPQPILTRLHEELVKILNQPDVRSRIEADGSLPVGSSPEEFRRFMRADMDKWAKLVKESGAKLD